MAKAAPWRESRWLVGILIVAVVIAVAVGAITAIVGDEHNIALTIVIAAATIAYTGLTWRLAVASEADRHELRAREGRQHLHRLRAVLVELDFNVARRERTHVWYAHTPFERSAFDAARGDFGEVDDVVFRRLTEVDFSMAAFNAVAAYHTANVRAGQGTGDTELERYAIETCNTCERAAVELRNYLRDR